MKIGFIGCGNMARAMISGFISSNTVSSNDILASTLTEKSAEEVRDLFDIFVSTDNLEIASMADVLILAVKPHFYESVIKEIREEVSPETIVVSIAPGKTLEDIIEMFGKETKIIRTMPNTPAMVGEGMTAICKNEFITSEDLHFVKNLMDSFGESEIVNENMMDAVVAVSGSSPAYAFMFIEALADGAVLNGMPREKAYEFAAQALYGASKMVLDTKIHPAELKDQVCSPGGTTIEAVRVLENKGFRSAIIEAMTACAEKSKRM